MPARRLNDIDPDTFSSGAYILIPLELADRFLSEQAVTDYLGFEDGMARTEHIESVPAFYKLMIGTLAKAVSDYVRYRGNPNPKLRSLYREARLWLFDEKFPGSGEPLGSFAWVCRELDREPGPARERIRKMKITDLPKVDRK